VSHLLLYDVICCGLVFRASVYAQDNFKWTPLHHAAHCGQVDVVHALLAAGADGNAQTWNGASPLMRAIQSGKTNVVEFLLECGVNVTLKNKKDKTAVDVAQEWAGSKIYNMVKNRFDLVPKPKPDKKGNQRPATNKPLTIPPLKNIDPNLTEDDLKTREIIQKLEERNEIEKSSDDVTDDLRKRPQSEKLPKNPSPNWTSYPTTEDLMQAKKDDRSRYGDEVDFDSYKKPLKQNIDIIIDKFQQKT